jgi:hypothetical protein
MEPKNIVISKEYLDKIRKFTAIRPRESFVYVPVVFRELPEEQRPRFTLQPISGEDTLRFSDSMRGEVAVEGGKALVSVKRGAYTVNVVRAGLVSWENYFDIEGVMVAFKPGNIENLPLELLEELSDMITSRSSLTQEEILGLK